MCEQFINNPDINYDNISKISSNGGSLVTKYNLTFYEKKYFFNDKYDINDFYTPNQQKHYNNEIKFLNKLKNYNFFPKILFKNEYSIFLSHCGEKLTNKNIPEDWKKQLLNIYESLKNNNIYHNDITIDNITVLNKKLFLIDFGWANNICSFPYFNIDDNIINSSKNIFEMFEKIINNSIEFRLKNITLFVKNQNISKLKLKIFQI